MEKICLGHLVNPLSLSAKLSGEICRCKRITFDLSYGCVYTEKDSKDTLHIALYSLVCHWNEQAKNMSMHFFPSLVIFQIQKSQSACKSVTVWQEWGNTKSQDSLQLTIHFTHLKKNHICKTLHHPQMRNAMFNCQVLEFKILLQLTFNQLFNVTPSHSS